MTKREEKRNLETIPVGSLGIIPLEGCRPLGEKVDYYIASEAGITDLFGEWIDINMAVIEDEQGKQSIGTSQGFPIPKKYREEIKESELRKGNG